MQVFEAKLFRDYLAYRLRSAPRGELRRISQEADIHSTTMSQALRGQRPFSLEQVEKIASSLGLNELETRFCLLLVQEERAGTERLREIFKRELAVLRQQSHELVHVVKKDKSLSSEERSIFYSNWYYAGAAVLSSLPDMDSVPQLSYRLGLSKQRTAQVVEFLLRSRICVEERGKIKPGVSSTHLDSGSPFISRHHGNWRLKAMERHPNLDAEELAYSSPMSLSAKDAKKIRSLLVDLVRKVAEIREPSPCEQAYTLNIDWLKF